MYHLDNSHYILISIYYILIGKWGIYLIFPYKIIFSSPIIRFNVYIHLSSSAWLFDAIKLVKYAIDFTKYENLEDFMVFFFKYYVSFKSKLFIPKIISQIFELIFITIHAFKSNKHYALQQSTLIQHFIIISIIVNVLSLPIKIS